jgi:large subunit ribosomal protein L3
VSSGGIVKERKLGIIGKKIGMTLVFNDAGVAQGVTVLLVGPCMVMGKRTVGRDGYNALRLGFASRKANKVNKSEAGVLKAIGGIESARRYIVEMRVSDATLGKFEPGQEITLNDMGVKEGDLIDICGTSKGKGFAGVMKRHHFGGFRATHGTHEYFRHGGSIGCRKWPGRVFKGRKMPGHMGDRRVTTQNIKVVQVRAAENVLLVHGSVPGPKNAMITVRPAIKRNPRA